MRFTPDNIKELAPDEIFVFGSNLAGHHGGGAARVALDRFGAQWGQGEGTQGQSTASPQRRAEWRQLSHTSIDSLTWRMNGIRTRFWSHV